MAHRRRSFAEVDDRWDAPGLEAIDLRAPGSVASPPAARGARVANGRTRRRHWAAALGFCAITAAAGYSLVNHRAATDLVHGWQQAREEAEAVTEVIEGLRAAGMLADVSGEDPETFVRVRQATVGAMRDRVVAHRHELAETTPIDPKLISLRIDAIARLDEWVAEMDAFIDRRGLWLRTPDFERIDPRIEQAQRRWRVDQRDVAVPAMAGAAYLERLERPADQPLPFVVTAVTTSGDRLDIDLRQLTTTRTDLDADVTLGAVTYGMEVDGSGIVVTSQGRALGRLPVEPSSDVEPLVPTEHPVRTPAPIDVAVDVAPTDLITGASTIDGWTVVGVRRGARLGLRAVERETGRVVTIRVPDPYVNAFVAHAGT